jgi:GNAT superfamily N-acetyltransferase
MPHIEIRTIDTDDYEDWKRLWLANAHEEGGDLGDDVIAQCWAELMRTASDTQNASGIFGLVAEIEGLFAGFLHYVLHPVAGAAQPVCYLQDVYVAPEYRRHGVGRALLDDLKERSHDLDWERIYWLVKGDDAKAAAFYKDQSVQVDFKVHMHPTRLLKDMNE